jgi:surface antigen
MFRPVLIAVPLILAPLALSTAAHAQGRDCGQRNEGRHRAGGLLGGFARGALGHFGGSAATVLLPVGSLLGDAIMNLLDCDEQQKAATATEEAVRGGVGTTANWRSETRPGHVTGSSTVTAAENGSPQGQCVTVTDIVIVDGEETRAPKRMCRRPPSDRYVRV